MTIAITLKVNEGIVLATDSATTIESSDGVNPPEIVNVYNNANKVFNLRKSLPLGAMTWGTGTMGVMTISGMLKALRERFTDEEDEWHINPKNFTVIDVASKFAQFIYEEHYQPAFAEHPSPKPAVGFVVAGYSSGQQMAEEYLVTIDDKGNLHGPTSLRGQSETGANWWGQPEALDRLLLGYSRQVPGYVRQIVTPRPPSTEGLDQTEIEATLAAYGETVAQKAAAIDNIFDILSDSRLLRSPVENALMPIQDAIDLADFLVDLTIKYTRFMPGSSTVGGPIEIAAITRYEGFKWIRRKHYFDDKLNPRMAKEVTYD